MSNDESSSSSDNPFFQMSRDNSSSSSDTEQLETLGALIAVKEKELRKLRLQYNKVRLRILRKKPCPNLKRGQTKCKGCCEICDVYCDDS